MIGDFLSSFTSALVQLILLLLDFLPSSPTGEIVDQINTFNLMPYINWFIPFDFCFEVFGMWISCVTAFYAYQYGVAIFEKMKIF